jgi:hypothetical protein
MPKNDHEVFQRLSEDAETPLEIDFIAYAMFAYQKKQWIAHREREMGNQPSQAEIDTWIADISDWQFENIRKQAVDFFDEAARTYLEDEIATAKQQALESAIVQKVQAAGAFLEAIRNGAPNFHTRSHHFGWHNRGRIDVGKDARS